MNLLRFLLRESPATVLVVFATGLVGGVASVGLIAVINRGVADFAAGAPAPLGLFAGLCVVMLAGTVTSHLLTVQVSRRAVFDLCLRLSGSILATPLRRLEEIGAHRLLATLTTDIQAVAGALTLLPILAVNVTTIFVCLAYLGWISWKLLLVLLAFVGIGLVTYQLPMTLALKFLRRAREHQDRLMGHYRGLIHGIKELKLHGRRRSAFYDGELRGSAEQVRRNNVFGLGLYTAAEAWGSLLFFVCIGLILFGAPRFIAVDAATVSSFIVATLFMLTSLSFLLGNLPTMGNASVSLRKVESLGLSLGTAEEGGAGPRQEPEFSRLELVGIAHQYYREREERTFRLGPVDLELRPGEVVYLVGGNGSGKTTLVKLLTGLYTPEEGEIRLDGEPVTEETREAYRHLFSVVFDDFFLFESLLGLDSPQATERARHYLEQLQIDHKVSVEAGRLSTTELSQGQRKRLALLTAYLEDRAIYVFDEWAADQDPLFKEIFYRQILPELKARGKAVLAITHDDRYFDEADRLVKLDYGRIEFDRRLDEDRGERRQRSLA